MRLERLGRLGRARKARKARMAERLGRLGRLGRLKLEKLEKLKCFRKLENSNGFKSGAQRSGAHERRSFSHCSKTIIYRF